MAASPNGPPGNNGTVKIHDGAGEPASETRNEPHVCTFHLHFFFADPEQCGTWEIQKWSPGPKGTVVLSGTYDTFGDGEDRQPEQGEYSLPDGHYKLFWDGDLDTHKHDKMKVFWVECEAAGTVAGTPTPAPTQQGQPGASESAAPGRASRLLRPRPSSARQARRSRPSRTVARPAVPISVSAACSASR